MFQTPFVSQYASSWLKMNIFNFALPKRLWIASAYNFVCMFSIHITCILRPTKRFLWYIKIHYKLRLDSCSTFRCIRNQKLASLIHFKNHLKPQRDKYQAAPHPEPSLTDETGLVFWTRWQWTPNTISPHMESQTSGSVHSTTELNVSLFRLHRSRHQITIFTCQTVPKKS